MACYLESIRFIGGFRRLRLSNREPAYRAHFTSGLEVSYGLRLALKSIFERKEFII